MTRRSLRHWLVRAERAFWRRAVRTCPKPVTVRALARHTQTSPMTVVRRLRRFRIRYR